MVYLSRGRRHPYIPQQLLGKDIFWWLTRSGAMKLQADTVRARLVRRNEPVVASSMRALRKLGVEIVGRVRAAHDDHVILAGGRQLRPRTVVWATGFRFDFSWIDVPVFDEQGTPVHERGVTGARGLYFLGLPWQHTPGSALLGWVGHDAGFIASEICSFLGINSPSNA